jgi:hypothetical protein
VSTLLLTTSGDTAAWIGAAGTWAIGALAGVIAYLQLRHSKFRPKVRAFVDAERRVLVRVDNEGTGAGSVQDVHLFYADHKEPQIYKWELDDAVTDQQLVPFHLGSGASAQLFLVPDDEVELIGLRVVVAFGNRKKPDCRELKQTAGHLFGTTYIEGVTN